ncbi:MAG TPA: hypothetical protein ENK18_05115 [Deltaproteobacteria bacterium]|nr:hypothetical protein [Deltaproteobacteria bacterium]
MWSNVLAGSSGWSSLSLTVAEILSLQALAWVPLLVVPLLEGLLVIAPALLILRRRALREATERPALAAEQVPQDDVLGEAEAVEAEAGETLHAPSGPDLSDEQRPTDLFEDFSDLDDTGDLEYIEIEDPSTPEDELEYIEIEDDGTMEDDVETERLHVPVQRSAPPGRPLDPPPVQPPRPADRIPPPPPVPEGLTSITPARGAPRHTPTGGPQRTSDGGPRVRPASD